MTPQIATTLAIIVGALILFATDKLRVDIIALLVELLRSILLEKMQPFEGQ